MLTMKYLLLVGSCVLTAALGAAPARASVPLWTAEAAGILRGVEVFDDRDGDGLKDLLVVGDDGVRIYRAGVPASPGSILEEHPGPWPFSSVVHLVGDLNGSGGSDAVVSVSDGFGADMLIWNDAPAMNPPVSYDAVDPGRLDYNWRISRTPDMDFDRDGFSDFAMSSYDGVDGWFYHGAAFGPLQKTLLNHWSERCRAAEIVPDINADGYPDLLTAHEDIYQYPAFVDIRFGGPGADLAVDLRIELPDSLGPALGVNVQIVSLDFDGDGQPDFAVTGPTNSYPPQPGAGMVVIFRGGTELDDVPDFVLRAPPGAVRFGEVLGRAGDADGDGYEDLAVGMLYSPVFVYLGGPAADERPDLWVTTDDYSRIIRPVGDWDGDGRDEILYGDSVFSPEPFDCNGDGVPDLDQPEVMEDCDGSLFPDLCEIQQGWASDCDGNLRIDDCDLGDDPSLDCDDNGMLDVCDVVYSSRDCDRNGLVDTCELEDDPALDCNGDGRLDDCQLDEVAFNCNANGYVDTCEDHGANTWLDCDGDGIFDSCQIENDPGLDLDGNGRLDTCDGPLRLRVGFDPLAQVHELDIMQAGQVDLYVVLEADGAFDASSIDQLSFEVLLPDQVFMFTGDVVVPGVIDFEDRSVTRFVLEVGGILDLGTPVTLAHLSGFVPDSPPQDARISLGGAAVDPWLPAPAVPRWTDATGADHPFGQFHSAFINRTFDDCNANEIDDLVDIEYGYALDENSDLIPDSCQVSAAAPAGSPRARLFPGRPNPFNARTSLYFELDSASYVRLDIFDTAGRRVRNLVSGRLDAGPHTRTWDGKDDHGVAVASGVYLVALDANGMVVNQRMALVR